MSNLGRLLTDGYTYHPWLYPCDRCGATNYGCRIPDELCDQCITKEEMEQP